MGLSCTDLRGYEKLISLWGGGEEVTCHNTRFRAKGMERVSEQKASTSLIQCNLLGSTRNLRCLEGIYHMKYLKRLQVF